MSLTIRVPVAEEADEIALLHVESWKETYGHLLPADFFSSDYSDARRQMWQRVLAEPRDDATIRVANLDGEIIGFAWVGRGIGQESEAPPRDRQLYAIYVLAAHHGSGVGQALLDATLGSGPAMLWVAKENPRAVAFYTRNGFRLDGAEEIDPSRPTITGVRMVR
jgi:ribosomal protein S18 acetylase RimI-like enzyme